MAKPIKAWHFVASHLRDGRLIPKDGEWLKHTGEVRLCQSGLHASLHPWDALQYAPGHVLCEVMLKGDILRSYDKVAASERMIVRRVNMRNALGYFARMQALSAIHLWDAPGAVLDFLMTGEGEKGAERALNGFYWGGSFNNFAALAKTSSAYALLPPTPVSGAVYAASYAADATGPLSAANGIQFRRETRRQFAKLVSECFP